MPVLRFRDHDDARKALWAEAGDPRLAERLRRLYGTAARICPLVRTPGIQKFRTLEDADAARAHWARRPWPEVG